MYQAFDAFLATPTWHTRDAFDDARFYEVLATVVREPDFNPEKLGEYFRNRLGIDSGHGHPMDSAIQHYVEEAWAVREFLITTEGIGEA